MAEPCYEAERLAVAMLELGGQTEPCVYDQGIWCRWRDSRQALAEKIQAVIDKAKEQQNGHR